MTMLRARQPAEPKPTVDVDRLDHLLGTLIGEHRTLLSLAQDHRDALSNADGSALKDIVEQSGEVIARIRSIESERRRIVTAPSGKPSTMDELIDAADEADRERLAGQTETLRGLIETVRNEHEAVRVASEALATHVRGLMQQVSQRLSHSGTYGRAGRVDAGDAVVTGLDLGA